MVILIKTLQVIAALSLLIILHEGGHFLFAKLFKTRVEKFYLFFDYKFHLFSTYDRWFRRLLGKPAAKKKENGEYEYEGTEYGIGWIPLGGYVKIAGMIDESMDLEQMKQPAKAYEFRTKPAWQRLLIMLGGIIVNFIAAFVIYALVLFTWGESFIRPADMTYGMKFSEQAKADGFRDGDIILGVDDKTFDDWQTANLRAIANGHEAHVLRDGQEITIALPDNQSLLDMLEEPRYADMLIPSSIDSVLPGSTADKLGLQKGDRIVNLNGKALADHNELTYAVAELAATLSDESTHADSLRARTVCVGIIANNTDSVVTKQAVLDANFMFGFTNAIPDYKVSERHYSFLASFPAGVRYGIGVLSGYVNDLKYVFTKKGARSVGGFIAIGNIFPATWSWYKFWMLTALLSIMLGFMNVLPIPALDGGHALFAIFEICTGRKPSDKFLERAQYVGMFFLLGLLLFANLNDILRIFGI